MRVVYYTHSALLTPTLSLMQHLSQAIECHVVVELSPWSWQVDLLDLPPRPLPEGLLPAETLLGPAFPTAMREYWRSLASFHFIVHRSRKSIGLSAWQTSRQVVDLVRRVSPDILHIDGTPRRMAPALLTLRSQRVVLAVHDPLLHRGEHNLRTELLRQVLYRRASRLVLHNGEMKAAFCARYGLAAERVDTVLLGVYEILTRWRLQDVTEEPRTVLFFGRLSAYKGLDVLYRALPSVAARVSDLRVVVAGRPVDGYAAPRAPVLPNGGVVQEIRGYVSNTELAELFARATVVVCPYTDATQSGVILTAYAFGKPVVATRVGGVPEYVVPGVTGLLVAGDKALHLAQALSRVLCDGRLRQQLKDGVATVARAQLSWEEAAQRMRRVYDRALVSGR